MSGPSAPMAAGPHEVGGAIANKNNPWYAFMAVYSVGRAILCRINQF